MWSLRKNLHKTSAIGRIGTPINCDTGLSANGNTGVYIVNAIVGTDIGRVTLTYDSFNIPDRFQIIYDGNIVADSKYVGDSLGSFNVLGTFTLPQKEFDGFQFINNGQLFLLLNLLQLQVIYK